MTASSIEQLAFSPKQESTVQEWEVLSPSGNPIKDQRGVPLAFPSKYAAKSYAKNQTKYNEVTVRRVR